MWLRVIVFVAIIAAIYIGVRRIAKDWRERLRDLDDQTRQRDLKERQRPDVIDLTPDKDGVFRPGSDNDNDGAGR